MVLLQRDLRRRHLTVLEDEDVGLRRPVVGGDADEAADVRGHAARQGRTTERAEGGRGHRPREVALVAGAGGPPVRGGDDRLVGLDLPRVDALPLGELDVDDLAGRNRRHLRAARAAAVHAPDLDDGIARAGCREDHPALLAVGVAGNDVAGGGLGGRGDGLDPCGGEPVEVAVDDRRDDESAAAAHVDGLGPVGPPEGVEEDDAAAVGGHDDGPGALVSPGPEGLDAHVDGVAAGVGEDEVLLPSLVATAGDEPGVGGGCRARLCGQADRPVTSRDEGLARGEARCVLLGAAHHDRLVEVVARLRGWAALGGPVGRRGRAGERGQGDPTGLVGGGDDAVEDLGRGGGGRDGPGDVDRRLRALLVVRREGVARAVAGRGRRRDPLRALLRGGPRGHRAQAVRAEDDSGRQATDDGEARGRLRPGSTGRSGAHRVSSSSRSGRRSVGSAR